ncbi:unnamed protein product [Urochloa humidicola]
MSDKRRWNEDPRTNAAAVAVATRGGTAGLASTCTSCWMTGTRDTTSTRSLPTASTRITTRAPCRRRHVLRRARHQALHLDEPPLRPRLRRRHDRALRRCPAPAPALMVCGFGISFAIGEVLYTLNYLYFDQLTEGCSWPPPLFPSHLDGHTIFVT